MKDTVVVSLLALLFTVGSFWWIQVRSGRLVAYAPWTYSAVVSSHTLRLRLPVSIYNTGAKTLVVTDLRLVIVNMDLMLPAISYRHTVRPGENDVVDFPYPFHVRGRDVTSLFVEFGSDGSVLPDLETAYVVRVDGMRGDSGEWSELVTLTLTTPLQDRATRYLSHPIDPAQYPYRSEELRKTFRASTENPPVGS